MKNAVKNLFPHREMQFQPIDEDDDDLSNLIKSDPDTHDNKWELTDDLDGAKLNDFWDDALKDLGAEEPEE